jgi:hypothetical protein
MIKTDIKTILNTRFGQPKKGENTAHMSFLRLQTQTVLNTGRMILHTVESIKSKGGVYLL